VWVVLGVVVGAVGAASDGMAVLYCAGSCCDMRAAVGARGVCVCVHASGCSVACLR
jgi:hypothetical protein